MNSQNSWGSINHCRSSERGVVRTHVRVLVHTGFSFEIEVSIEQHRNAREGKTGYPRESQRHRPTRFPHAKVPGAAPPGIEPGSPWWEASGLTTTPPWPLPLMAVDGWTRSSTCCSSDDCRRRVDFARWFSQQRCPYITLPKLHVPIVVMLHRSKRSLHTGSFLMTPSMAAFAEDLSTVENTTTCNFPAVRECTSMEGGGPHLADEVVEAGARVPAVALAVRVGDVVYDAGVEPLVAVAQHHVIPHSALMVETRQSVQVHRQTAVRATARAEQTRCNNTHHSVVERSWAVL
ncbi:hypothetical protein PR048_009772 [Dryococelus australis]|uniref:Uncharacterized protein n=1 Tax=Dryococelus australis TaxID=614101 RepID=A0ABQ9I0V9_9NEOP|nr:hypothetical protein PR048_009772 [Dryococelus australis]